MTSIRSPMPRLQEMSLSSPLISLMRWSSPDLCVAVILSVNNLLSVNTIYFISFAMFFKNSSLTFLNFIFEIRLIKSSSNDFSSGTIGALFLVRSPNL